jgi:hypothetical protein
MIAGSEADTRYFREEAIANAAEPRSVLWVAGAPSPTSWHCARVVRRD